MRQWATGMGGVGGRHGWRGRQAWVAWEAGIGSVEGRHEWHGRQALVAGETGMGGVRDRHGWRGRRAMAWVERRHRRGGEVHVLSRSLR